MANFNDPDKCGVVVGFGAEFEIAFMQFSCMVVVESFSVRRSVYVLHRSTFVELRGMVLSEVFHTVGATLASNFGGCFVVKRDFFFVEIQEVVDISLVIEFESFLQGLTDDSKDVDVVLMTLCLGFRAEGFVVVGEVDVLHYLFSWWGTQESVLGSKWGRFLCQVLCSMTKKPCSFCSDFCGFCQLKTM